MQSPVVGLDALPAAYAWLRAERAPCLLVTALSYYGIRETKGDQHNPEVIGWAREISASVGAYYKADEIPWCGVFMARLCRKCKLPIPAGFDAIRAKGYPEWGKPAATPMLGDVLVFERPGGGHVGLYVGEDDTAFHVLGGNQGDMVSIARISRNRLLAARRTPWKIGQPHSVRRIHLSANGSLSIDES